MGLTDDQLQAMEPSAPLLVAEVRRLHLQLANEALRHVRALDQLVELERQLHTLKMELRRLGAVA